MLTLDAVIPVMNQCQYTEALLRQLEHCPILPRTVYLIDNGSTDATQEICCDFVKRLPLQYIRFTKNIGVNAAWNLCFRNSDAELISVLNNDICINSDFFQRIIKTFETYAEAGIVVPNTVNYPNEFGHSSSEKVSVVSSIQGWAFTIRQSLIKQAGLIPDSLFIYFGDVLLFDICREEGYEIYQMDGNMIYHHNSRTCQETGSMVFFPSEQREYWRLTNARRRNKGLPLFFDEV